MEAACGARCSSSKRFLRSWAAVILTALVAIGVLAFALSFDWHGRAAGKALRGAALNASWPSGNASGIVQACSFDSPPATAYFWDRNCSMDGAGCNADRRHLQCRFCGAYPFVPCPATTTAVTTTTVTTETRAATSPVQCETIYSDMAFNVLRQSFPKNPDTKATGYVFCHACTSGRILCNATVFGGRTRLIASHIHLADDNDGADGEGGPVINFCGDNAQGLINDGVRYSSPCPAYKNSVATMLDMPGSFVTGGPNAGVTAADRLRDIFARPERYYFNFHSVASWAFWRARPHPEGMCRGELALKRQ